MVYYLVDMYELSMLEEQAGLNFQVDLNILNQIGCFLKINFGRLSLIFIKELKC
jgi:hypothetical protein